MNKAPKAQAWALSYACIVHGLKCDATHITSDSIVLLCGVVVAVLQSVQQEST